MTKKEAARKLLEKIKEAEIREFEKELDELRRLTDLIEKLGEEDE